MEINNVYAEDYFKQKFRNGNNLDDVFIPLVNEDGEETSLYELMTYEVDKELEKAYWQRETEIANYKEACKNEAFDLLKKYFYNLWD